MKPGRIEDVSRETLDALQHFADLLRKWTAKINLVSKATLDDLWNRHIADSAQVYFHAPPSEHWVDIGSGGGLPAIVCAILARHEGSPCKFTLVESDQRKCAFLRTAIRDLDLDATVLAKRGESLPSLGADIFTARALADLDTLLSLADVHLHPSGLCLLLKGENWRIEDQAARKQWSYTCEVIESRTNTKSALLKIKDIARA